MKAKNISIIIACALILFGCKPSVEEGLSYDQYISKAELAISASNVKKAILYYKQALKLKPSDATTHFVLGEIYHREYHRSYEEAKRKQTFQILTHPDTYRATYKDDSKELARFGLKIGYDTMAIQEFGEVIKYDSNNWQARYQIATDHFNKKHFQEAIEEYKKIMQINPKYINSYSLIGDAYLEIGELNLAVDNFNAAIKLTPGFDDYDYYKLALAYRKMNNRDKVAEIFKMLKDTKSPYFDDLRLALYN